MKYVGSEAIKRAKAGAKLYVKDLSGHWVPAGAGAISRAERMEEHALWIYGSQE